GLAMSFPYLSALIAVPAAGAAVVGLLPARRPEFVRGFALAVSVVVAVLAGATLVAFDPRQAGYRFVESKGWITALGIRYPVRVPMYFIIGAWGYDRRIYAALKFFIYTAFGSALLLVGILVLAFLHARAPGANLTFDLRTLMQWDGLAENTARWLFLAFFASFAIKVPLFPLHTWLPDAHVEAPTAGSVLLAGI